KIEEKKQLTEKNYEEYKKSNESKKFIVEQGKIKQENKIINEDVLKLKREFNNILSNLDSELKYENDEKEKEKEKILKFEKKQKQILTEIEEIGKKIWNDFKI
ncbi:MAG: hypothetical protein NTU63_00990, partial [Candidatus Pacearchaeota archaeon]|nr:hypothetical protein [Candidatus Pacearchaeota archaeon]